MSENVDWTQYIVVYSIYSIESEKTPMNKHFARVRNWNRRLSADCIRIN